MCLDFGHGCNMCNLTLYNTLNNRTETNNKTIRPLHQTCDPNKSADGDLNFKLAMSGRLRPYILQEKFVRGIDAPICSLQAHIGPSSMILMGGGPAGPHGPRRGEYAQHLIVQSLATSGEAGLAPQHKRRARLTNPTPHPEPRRVAVHPAS